MAGPIKMSSTKMMPEVSAEGEDMAPAASPPADAETDLETLHSVPERFSVHDEQSANWLVRRIVSARQYAERVKVWADQEQHRAAQEEKTLLFLFGRQMEQWVRSEIEKLGGRRKSLALPAGTVGYRKVASTLVVDDERAVLSWAREHLPNAIVVIEKLSKTVINEYTKQTGVIPEDGVHIEPCAERFYVR